MYLKHFELRAKPFDLLPDPGFLFPSAVHKRALAYLRYGLQEQSGFILLTGEVGAGKTTLIRSLLRQIPSQVTLAKIFNTQVNSTQLLRLINEDFGLEHAINDKTELLRSLNSFLIAQYAAGRRSVLIIDEAQNLGAKLLEEIRLLSNLETDQAALLQIILVGQPELRERLNSPELIQLRQRILVHCHLSSLNYGESSQYILHRLEKAGNRNALKWNPGCMETVHAVTRGIPRLINILCDYILLDAFSMGMREVEPEHLKALLEQLDFETQFWPVVRQRNENGTGRVNKAELDAVQLKNEVLMAAVADLARRMDIMERDHRAHMAAFRSMLSSVRRMEGAMAHLEPASRAPLGRAGMERGTE